MSIEEVSGHYGEVAGLHCIGHYQGHRHIHSIEVAAASAGGVHAASQNHWAAGTIAVGLVGHTLPFGAQLSKVHQPLVIL